MSSSALVCPKGWTAQTPAQNWAGDFCLRPKTPVLESLRAETPALLAETLAHIGQQWLHFVKDDIKPYSTSRRGCGFHSLSFIVAELQSTRSSILATRTQSPFGI
jgi:hypothetical protein